MARHDPRQASVAADQTQRGTSVAVTEEQVYVLSRRALREVDRLAVSEFAVPSIILMENAALHLAEVALDILEDSEQARVLVACGPGNNGGDGLAAARHLHNAGVTVHIVLSGPADKYTEDAAINLAIVRRMGLPITETLETDPAAAMREAARGLGGVDLVIDALLGTGLDKPVREPLAALIREINTLSGPGGGCAVVAADVPSGLDADTGEPLGVAVKAGTTVSFVGLKEGFLKLAAQSYIGDVVVADIGAPRELVRRLGRVLEDHEPHDEPAPRPGHTRDSGRTVKPGDV
jgi:hydroxyethylthiazole kinase-like uncharacterized protein yjeF